MARRVDNMNLRFLQGKTIGISISETSDMAIFGLGREHLDDAMAEIAAHLLACGAHLSYGGDLREGGFTELLFEIVNRHRSNINSEQILVRNYMAWPVHATMTAVEKGRRKSVLDGIADLIFLSPAGDEEYTASTTPVTTSITAADWSHGLTAMRHTMSLSIDARVVLGGRTSNFMGRLPGIAEEALFQLESRAPLFLLGGFGGCALDLARTIGLTDFDPTAPDWSGREYFKRFKANDLNNGLTEIENRQLAKTAHVDEAIALMLRGLMRLHS